MSTLMTAASLLRKHRLLPIAPLFLALGGAFLKVGSVAAQRRTDLPPPDGSRAPLITQLPPDSIRLQVRQLLLMQLLQNIQRADSVAIDAELGAVEWGALDQVSQLNPRCRTLGGAVRTSAEQLRASSTTLATRPSLVFFDQIQIQDSGTVGRASGQAVLLVRGRKVRKPFEFVYDSTGTAWLRASGLLSAICDARERLP